MVFSILARCYVRKVRLSFVSALMFTPLAALAQDAAPPIPAAPAQPGVFDHKALLEQTRARSDALQARILAAREKVLGLRADVIRDNLTPTRLLLSHKNDVGASFAVEAIEYELDGVIVSSRANPLFDAAHQLEILNGDVRPGDHELRVTITLMGTGTGPYASVGGYRFKVPASFKLVTPNARLTEATVIASVRPDADIDVRQRFSVRLEASSIPLVPRPKPAP